VFFIIKEEDRSSLKSCKERISQLEIRLSLGHWKRVAIDNEGFQVDVIDDTRGNIVGIKQCCVDFLNGKSPLPINSHIQCDQCCTIWEDDSDGCEGWIWKRKEDYY